MEKPAKAVNIRHRKHISTFPVWVVFLCMMLFIQQLVN